MFPRPGPSLTVSQVGACICTERVGTALSHNRVASGPLQPGRTLPSLEANSHLQGFLAVVLVIETSIAPQSPPLKRKQKWPEWQFLDLSPASSSLPQPSQLPLAQARTFQNRKASFPTGTKLT